MSRSCFRSLFLLLLAIPLAAVAAADMEELLPPVSCGPGWKIEGNLSFYDKETLSDRINGEAEFYFPYGFDRMAAARYSPSKSTGAGMDVEIYRMGSLLDAFGMFANYRQKEGRSLGIGAESNLSSSQLYLYKGRHFVHIQTTGSEDLKPDSMAECGMAVATRLPGDNGRPAELSAFDRPRITKGSERYLPQSLLGYDFLNRGIIADAELEGTALQVFLLFGTTLESASVSFEKYRSQLGQGTIEAVGESGAVLQGADPLYGPVTILKQGKCFAGALKYGKGKSIRPFLESLCR